MQVEDDSTNSPMMDFSRAMDMMPNQVINFTQTLSGNPKPNVSLYILNGISIGNITSRTITNHTYKYELVNQRYITVEDCGKDLIFNATNEYGFIENKTQIFVDCK